MRQTDGLGVVRVSGWERFAWLRHGFTTRLGGVSDLFGGGDLNLGMTVGDRAEVVQENRVRAVAEVGKGVDFRLITLRQIHGVEVRLVGADGEAQGAAADGMMTDSTGVMLGIQVADCVPVLLMEAQRRVVAALHAGWRGTVEGIVSGGVAGICGANEGDFATFFDHLYAAVGPSIGPCCYTVGEEVRERFTAKFSGAESLFAERDGGLYLDLWEANRRQLVAAGVREDRIAVVGECTACARVEGRRKYFSYRAEGGVTGRAMGMIGIADGI